MVLFAFILILHIFLNWTKPQYYWCLHQYWTVYSFIYIYLCVSHSVVSNSLWPHGLLAHQAPLSMGFSRQEYRSGLPIPSPGNIPDPGIEPGSPSLQADPLWLYIYLPMYRYDDHLSFLGYSVWDHCPFLIYCFFKNIFVSILILKYILSWQFFFFQHFKYVIILLDFHCFC